jgi:2-hydroxy-3-keto-5-methylthiopentenyl-1-phosphate phosphatase
MKETFHPPTHYLLASDFDQTLSFNDSGVVLSQLLGRPEFEDRVAGMSRMHLVQPGGELTYLLRHDPEFRCVRREHLIEAGRRVRLKKNVDLLARILADGLDGHRFSFYVISAAPEDVVTAALEGIVPPERIFGTRLRYHPVTGEIQAIERVAAGYGKVAVLEDLQQQLQTSPDHVAYMGDGSSDIHVMLHVNHRHGFTIAVSENHHVVPIARRTVLSDSAPSVLVPILEDLLKWDSARIRAIFAAYGLSLNTWDKAHTDRVALHDTGPVPLMSGVMLAG